jgi:indolepyruvate ferredoxin oxidoreductase beta subunit
MLGAIAASGVLPWPRALFEASILGGAKAGAQASLRGFAQAFDAMSGRRQQQASVAAALAPPDLLALARARLLDYQDEAYVQLFDQRLARVEAAAPAPHAGEIVHETGRWLALWMAFDDLVRVAQLKLATSRMARVRREVKAAEGEVLKVFDHFKPGVAEVASLLPAGLAARLQAWEARRVAAGREPWAWPVRLASHGVFGALMLRALASLKGQRRRGQRFAQEQALIERWLAAIGEASRDDGALALEVARCGRLIKGYGSTNERGKERLLHVIDHLARGPSSPADRAAAIRSVRTAALADDSGKTFDEALVQHGAPPRPPKPQPIRWYKRKPEQPARA